MSHFQDKKTPALVHPLKFEVKMTTGLHALRVHVLSVQIYAHLCTSTLFTAAAAITLEYFF